MVGKKHRMLCIFLCVFLIVVSSVHAAQFSVAYELINDKIFSDEVAKVNLTIHNTGQEKINFQIFSADPRWLIYTTPSQVSVGPKQSLTVSTVLDPTSLITTSGNYGVPIVVKALKLDQSIQVEPVILINSDRYREYLPSVFLGLEVGEEGIVDPLQKVPVRIRVINKNVLSYETFTVKIESKLFSDSYTTKLDGKDDFFKVLYYSIDQQTPPDDFIVTATMMGDNKSIGQPISTTFSINPSSPAFVKDTNKTQSIFSKSWTITFTNTGNIPKQEQMLLASNSFANMFTDASHAYEIIEHDGVQQVAFTISLDPSETTTLVVRRDYRGFVWSLVLIIALLIIITILYYTLRSPVLITRAVHSTAKTDDATSKVKILLHIKNRTGKTIEQIKIYEQLPHITEVEESFEIGTIKPTRVLKGSDKGTLVRWDFSTLEPFEERIVTYRLKSKLSILGQFNLSPTVLKYKSGKRTKTFKFRGLKRE